MRKPVLFWFLLSAGLLLTRCVSQYKVMVDFSPSLRDYYTEIPTIEVDIAAVTDGEADEVKQAGVEKYFAPDSGIRERLQAQTCFFYREEQRWFVLPSRAPIWQTWKLKEPTSILVIASLPHDPSIVSQANQTPQTDPRYLVVKMARSYVIARTLNILVEPKRIVQVKKLSSSSKEKEDPPVVIEQWVESRKKR